MNFLQGIEILDKKNLRELKIFLGKSAAQSDNEEN
jgi:hypothetical protein